MRAKEILWVDYLVTSTDPTWQHLVAAIPRLLDNGWKIDIWCQTTDVSDSRIRIKQFSKLPGPSLLNLLWFSLATAGRFGFDRLAGRSSPVVVHSSGGHCLFANITTFQFVNFVWLRRHALLGFVSVRDFLRWLQQWYGLIEDQIQFRNRNCRIFLAVSEAAKAQIAPRLHKGAQCLLLPNSYDDSRFNLEARDKWRVPTREALGYAPEDKVFIFVSQGHYKRKGFWLAVEALASLRSGDEPVGKRLHLLVVGGTPKNLQEVQTTLDNRAADWRNWIRFVGMQKNCERYFAASDAFLFPSYYETFAIVAVEALAMGLPIFVTRYNGTEMYLREAENGFALEESCGQIKNVVAAFLASEWQPGGSEAVRKFDRVSYARRLEEIYTCMAASALQDR